MKKLTWALLSLMLLLGLGVASAQDDEGGGETPTTTLPTPTFKPDNNATVAPGTAISIILPEELDITKYVSVGVMYVENNDDVVLDTTLAGWTAAIMEDMGGGIGDWSTAEDGEGDGEGERVWKTAVVDNDDNEPTFGMWSNPVKVSADATGTVKLRMRLVAATQADIAYSAEFVAEYTIDANAVVKPTAPTFTLNDEGVLSIENGYTDQLHQILYKIDGTDADFEGMTDMSTMGAKMTENGLQEYGGPIAYAAGQTVKAVTLEVIYDLTAGENMPVLVSDIETYHQPLPAPSFANAGEVTQGDQLDITFPAGLNWNAYKDMAIILYVENDNSTALEFDGTLGELQALAMQGSIINPFADGDDDDPVAAPAFKLAVYDNEEEGWNPVVALSTVGTVNVRARMAAGLDYGKAPYFSGEFTATYTVTERPKPNAPAFLVDDEEVEGSLVILEENEKVEVSWSGYPVESSQDHVVVYTTDGSEEVFAAENMFDEIMDKANMWDFFVDEAIEVSAPMEIKAAVAELNMSTYGITWSDIVTVNFAVKPAAPTFEPASGTKVDFGAELTLSCATEDAWILYTLDGSEPSADNDNAHYYNEDMKPGITAKTIKAVAMLKGVYSEVVTATYEFNPITATLSLVPVKDDTVGMNVGTGIEFSIDGWEEYAGVAVYYTVDGTTEPTEAAYEAQSDKANGAIKKLTVETKEYESWGETYTEIVRTDGHALAITFKEATHLKAIGTITVLGEKVTTTPLDAELKIKSAVKPTFSLADGTEVAEGDELVIENPNPYPEMPAMPEDWDDEEAVDAYRDAMDEYDAAVAAIPATIMYFSFDGTEPTSVAYDGQPAYEYDKWNVFKTGEGQNVTVFFQKDEEGYYLYVPEMLGYNSPADTVRLSGESLTLKAMSVTTEQGENGGGVSPYANRAAGGDFAFMYGSDFATAEFTVAEPDVVKELPETVEAPVFVPAAGAVKRGTEVTWTWNEEYDYDVMGVVYVANGKDEDLNIDAAKFEELVAAWGEEEENLVREDGKVYLYYEGEGAYKVEKAATLKARLVLGIMKAGEEDAELEIALSPVVTAAYTIDSLANEDLELAGVSVYPNPTSGVFNLELPVAATVEVFMSNGMLYQRMKLGEGATTLNIERSGIYFLRITGEGRTSVKRLIVR